jgi:Enoyl-(Acyl carrier protein) reductase
MRARFHPQSADCRRGIDQFHRNQLFGSAVLPANTFPVPVIGQGVQCHTPGCAECLPRQSALLKITHQAFCFSPAPMTSRPLSVVLTHAPSSSRNQTPRKGGGARRHTFDLLLNEAESRAPVGELVDIMDVGFACAYLATPYARRITGETLYVDGEFTSWPEQSRLQHEGQHGWAAYPCILAGK